MRYKIASLFPWILLAVVIGPAPAVAELEVRVEVPGAEFVRAEPIHLTGRVTNVSGEVLTLPRGLRPVFFMERVDGLPRPACADRKVALGAGAFTHEVPPGWESVHFETVDCGDEAGEYVVRFRVAVEPDGNPHVERDADLSVAGVVESAPARVFIREPEGEDRQALEAFGGRPLAYPEELVERFPASTYAGYAILGSRPWNLDPVAELELRGSFLAHARGNPDLLPQMERLESELRELSERRADLLDRYLEARPDFVYADFMRLELATRLGYLDRYDEAAALCERLRHNSPGIESDAAGALLRHFENIQVSHQNRGRLRDRVTYE